MERTIQKVNLTAIQKAPKQKRVAAYARVSCGREAMLHSLSAQVSYYSRLIQKTPGWDYAGVYADEALSGTKDTRGEFQKLLADCRAGKIDLIITKSISRFARNTVTTLQTVRELRQIGVDVYFEEQNIHTLGEEGEFVLTLLAAYAEEEARSVSENQMWRIEKQFQQGKPTSIDMFGYAFVKGRLEIIPEEAALIREAAKQYLDGATQEQLETIFNEAGVVGRHGKKFTGTGIITLLCNEKVVGDLLLQKTRCIDPITKVQKVNHGEWPQYFVSGSHEPILDRETQEKIFAERARRVEARGMNNRDCTRKHRPFSSIMVCGKCGKHFIQRTWDTQKHGLRAKWGCRTHLRSSASCATENIPEPLIEKLAAEAMGRRNFDAELFKQKIKEIHVPENGRLVFVFKDGHTVEKSHSFEWPEERRAGVCRQQQM